MEKEQRQRSPVMGQRITQAYEMDIPHNHDMQLLISLRTGDDGPEYHQTTGEVETYQ